MINYQQKCLIQALNMPLVRQIWSCMGFVHATRENFISYLETGYSCVVVPGGVGETLHLQSNSEVKVFSHTVHMFI